MGTTAEKGQRVLQSIAEVQEGINNLGGSLTDQTPFKNFRAELDNIYNSLPKTSYAEGSNITLSNTLKGKLDFEDGIVGIGQIEQETTEGYNLAENNLTSKTISGLTVTVNEDKSITINGTATALVQLNLLNNSTDGSEASARTLQAGSYTLTGCPQGSDSGSFFKLDIIRPGAPLLTDTGDGVTSTFSVAQNYTLIRIVIYSGTVCNNLVFKPMLNTGITAKPYEKYTNGASPSSSYPQEIEVVRGKNRFDIASDLIASEGGLSSVYNSDGTVTTTGIPTANYRRITNAVNINSLLQNGKSYTISQNSANALMYIQVTATNKSTSASSYYGCNAYSSRTFVADLDTYNYTLAVQSGSTTNWGTDSRTITQYYMLEEGSQATSYLPYNTLEVVERGKNEFKPTLTYNGTTIRETNCSVTLNNDEFTFSATGADMRLGEVISTGTAFASSYGYLMQIPDNATNVYLLVTNNAFDKCFVAFYDSNKTSLGFQSITTSKAIPSGAKYCNFRIGKSDSVADTTYTTKIMVAFSSIDTYEPYQTPQTYQLSLGEYEFAKIGNYVDTIEYDVDNDKVYKNEYIGKKILKDLEWLKETVGAVPYYYNDSETNFLKLNEGGTNLYCNIYKYGINQEDRAFIGNVHFIGLYSVTAYPNVNDFIQMLTNTNAYLYYMYKTPIKREITGTLKDQIKALYYSHSYNGTTIIEIDGQLPLIIKVRALKGE